MGYMPEHKRRVKHMHRDKTIWKVRCTNEPKSRQQSIDCSTKRTGTITDNKPQTRIGFKHTFTDMQFLSCGHEFEYQSRLAKRRLQRARVDTSDSHKQAFTFLCAALHILRGFLAQRQQLLCCALGNHVWFCPDLIQQISNHEIWVKAVFCAVGANQDATLTRRCDFSHRTPAGQPAALASPDVIPQDAYRRV